MSHCKLVWITPNAGQLISDIARVSSPQNQGLPGEGLLAYCVRNQHWSPFEMASACIEINTTRTIARQILRHRSFSFQEFSQRYADVHKEVANVIYSDVRLQHPTNRQSSIETDDDYLNNWWDWKQNEVERVTSAVYAEARAKGVAKEVARNVLPEGMTPSRMYMSGTIRSWMHYIALRDGNGTQKEHVEVAREISSILEDELPSCWHLAINKEI